MSGRILIYILSFFFFALVLFFCWHFLLSIYEVKYKTNFKSDVLVIDNEYFIKCVGLNSLGWEINYRNLNCNFNIIFGDELIRIEKNKDKNEFIFIPKSVGKLVIQTNSQLSLNPSQFNLKIINDTL